MPKNNLQLKFWLKMECILSFTEVHVMYLAEVRWVLIYISEINLRNLRCRSEIFELFNLLTTPYDTTAKGSKLCHVAEALINGVTII